MKSIKANSDLMVAVNGEAVLKHIEMAGRECYQSTHKITEDSCNNFVKHIIANGHESVLEHFSMTVHFNVDRGVTHEIVRHRMASYSQESTRYCNYDGENFGSEITVIDIREGIKLDPKMKNMSVHLINEIINEWTRAMEDAERHYLQMIHLGATPQIARSVLPQSVKAGLTMTANLREWRHFFKLRTDKPAHPQMREITIPLLETFKTAIPVIFDDITIAD